MSRRTPALATNLWAGTRHSNSWVRSTSLRNLNELGLLTREACDPFFADLTNVESAVRRAAIEAVTFSTNFAAELVPVLRRIARDDPDPGVRSPALGALLRYVAQTNVAPQLHEGATNARRQEGLE